MTALTELLGPTLASKSGEIETGAALSGKKAVALYFSAHWCPPCRGFTPELAKTYEAVKAAGKEFEIVFVSSDKDEKQFADYFGTHPWLALPFADRARKASLSKKYKVQGIPSLVVLDAETGETINRDGRAGVSKDPAGANWPWAPPSIWDCLGDEFLTADGDSVELSELRGAGKVLGLYFSAHWCPPCKQFTPLLAETYKTLKAAGKDFQVVFLSSDRSPSDFQSYFQTMPWLAIPQGDKRKDLLSERFEVEGIPTLVLIDAGTGAVINKNGRGAVMGDRSGDNFPWLPPEVSELSVTAEGINDETSLVLLMEGCTAEVQAQHKAVLASVAKASIAKREELIFFSACSSDGPVAQVRKLCGLGAPSAAAQLVLIDIPDEGAFYCAEMVEVSAENLGAFIASYKAKALTRKQLGQ